MYINLIDLAKELHWGSKRLKKYLDENVVAFKDIIYTFPNGSGHRIMVKKNSFYDIKKIIEDREAKSVDMFIERMSKNCNPEYTKSRKIGKGIHKGRNQIGSNGRSLCENVLRKGKTYIGGNGIINPVKLNIQKETIEKLKENK